MFTNSHPSRVLSFLLLNMKSTFSINVSFFLREEDAAWALCRPISCNAFSIYILKKNCTSFADLCKLVFSYRTRIRNHHVLCHWSHPVQDSGPHLTRTNVGSSLFFLSFQLSIYSHELFLWIYFFPPCPFYAHFLPFLDSKQYQPPLFQVFSFFFMISVWVFFYLRW